MKKNSLQSYTVLCRTKTELKTMNQIPKSPLRMSSLGVVHCIPTVTLDRDIPDGQLEKKSARYIAVPGI